MPSTSDAEAQVCRGHRRWRHGPAVSRARPGPGRRSDGQRDQGSAGAAVRLYQYLKTHLFGDIFARDNLDWRQRELATVAALSALSGVASQLQAHIRISLNVGLTIAQLKQLAATLADAGQTDAGQRLQAALDAHPGG